MEKEVIYDVKIDANDSVKTVESLSKELDSLTGVMDKLRKEEGDNAEGLGELEKAVESLRQEERKLLGDMEHLGETIKVEVSGSISKMEDRMYELALAGETAGDEFQDLLEKTAAYKRTIIETDRAVDQLSEQGKTLSGALSIAEGTVAGFQAFTGVTALLGTENEELLETITKLEAAQGVLNSISVIKQQLQANSIRLTNFQTKANLFLDNVQQNAAKSSILQSIATKAAAVAQRALNLIMNANPIALLIAGIAALVGAIALFTGGADDAKEKQEELADAVDEVNQALERQNGILDAQFADQKKRLDNTNKLIDSEIKYLQAIKGRSKEEEATLQKKLTERQANNVNGIGLAIDNARKKTENFAESFALQFESIDNAIELTDIEDGVNDIDYNKVRAEIKGFKTELEDVLNSDIGADEKIAALQGLEKQYSSTTKKLNQFNRQLGEAEKEEFQKVRDGFSQVGSLITKNTTSLREFNNLSNDKEVLTAIQKQEAATARLQEQEKRREDGRKAAAKAQKEREQAELEAARELERITQENIAFAQRTEDLRISLIEDGFDKQLAALDIAFEREIASVKSNSEEANALKEQIQLDFFAKEKALNDERNKAKAESEKALIQTIAGIRNELTLTDNQLELQQLKEDQDVKLEQLKSGLELDLITEAEFLELKALQEQEFADRQKALDKSVKDAAIAEAEVEQAKKLSLLNEYFSQSAALLNGLSSLNDLVTQTQINNAEGSEEKQQQIRKKAFERSKKLQIAQATIAGIQGVINALTAPTLIPEPFGSIAKGINAGVVAATTAGNIAKIKSTKFDGGGSVGASSASGGSSSIGASASEAGSRDLTDIRTDLNNDGSVDEGQTALAPQKVYVVESDITGTQATVEQAESRATVG